MSNKGRKYLFTFDHKNFEKRSRKVPPVKFTCQALASGALSPHLKLCSKFLSYLQNRKDTKDFHYPVPDDPIHIPDYYKIIKHPMDFSTVGRKIFDQEYPDLEAFKADIDLIWHNCITYNNINSILGRRALRLKSQFDEKWNLHASIIKNIGLSNESIELMSQTLRITTEEFNSSNPSMQMFRMPPYIKQKITQFDRVSKQSKPDKDREDRNTYSLPPENILNQPMTTKDKYELAVAIDTLPPELLGEVIEILAKAIDLKRDQEIDIPFSSLDNSTLRTIEAYVKHAKDKESSVRRMYQNDTIPAEKQLEILKAEQQRVIAALEQKKFLRSSSTTSEFTSENETEDTSGDSETSGDSTATTSGESNSESESGDDA
ncbi:hypothetical protein M9Y10_044575 [Tritrichomonas musculus]|uniref:Bromodomain containing protein n=1 Tax=Tritrichomonas musculus TaxID=1915356 RepID=A0ABR2JT34_9EUKA